MSIYFNKRSRRLARLIISTIYIIQTRITVTNINVIYQFLSRQVPWVYLLYIRQLKSLSYTSIPIPDNPHEYKDTV